MNDFDWLWEQLVADGHSTETGREFLLHSRPPNLSGLTPLQWLRLRGPTEIMAAIDAEAAGGYQ